MRARSIALSLVLTAVPALAHAQAQEVKHVELTGVVGGMSFTQDLGSTQNIFMTVTGASENVGFGKFFGFRASWAFSRNFGAELSATRGSHAYALSVDDVEAGTANLGAQFDTSETFLSGGVIAQFPLRSGLVPYGTVGVGRLATRPSKAIQDLDQVSATDVSFGGGVKYWLPSPSWLGVSFDVRYHTANKGLTFPGSDGKPSGTEFTVGGIVRLF